MAKKKSGEPDPATIAFQAGLQQASALPICAALLSQINVIRGNGLRCPKDGWAVVAQSGRIEVHPSRRATPGEWTYVIAHCALHLGFNHFINDREEDRLWQIACDTVVDRFLNDLNIGTCPWPFVDLPGRDEEAIYKNLLRDGLPSSYGSQRAPDMVFDGAPTSFFTRKIDYPKIFAIGLTQALRSAVETAGRSVDGAQGPPTTAQNAHRWFVSNYPLLGAMAAAFKIVEDPKLCQRLDIAIGAVDAGSREIFINPGAALDAAECRFVIAHEILHVGLQHQNRLAGRDPYLWNVACDFVINGWLLEMGFGAMPAFGGLYDPKLKGLSAETIYDRIVQDLRRYRKLATLRGVGTSDILGPADGCPATSSDLDDFYRRALGQGLELHRRQTRGLIPADLAEEIEALSMPPIPWDVRLAQWFDSYFGPVETRRTFSRASRRQSSTPDIPRPKTVNEVVPDSARTFGVVLDTSGSMEKRLLAQALGSIAGYALSREVQAVRLVFCDATTYDEGYVAPETIAGRVKVRGRGGTVLQPGIDLLEGADDFPKDGPILIITDGQCDRFRSHREHAILTPKGARLPFVPRGPVFEIEE